MYLRSFDLYGIVIAVPKREVTVRLITFFCLCASAIYADCRISPVVTINGDQHRIGVVVAKDLILYGGILASGQQVFVRYEVILPLGGDVISSSERNVVATVEKVDVANGLTLLKSATPPEAVPVHLGNDPVSRQAIRWFLSRRAGYALGKFSPSVISTMPNTIVLGEASQVLVGVVSNGKFVSIEIIKTFLGVRLGRIPFFINLSILIPRTFSAG